MKFHIVNPVQHLANSLIEGDYAGALNLVLHNQLLGCAALVIGAALIWKACNAFTYN